LWSKISGKGKCRFPTSFAVISDIKALRYGYKYEYRKSINPFPCKLPADTLLKIYCSFETKKAIDQTYFKEINEIFHSSNRSYVVGKILLSDLKELESKFPEASIISTN
jgi:homoserine dehydrogenase